MLYSRERDDYSRTTSQVQESYIQGLERKVIDLLTWSLYFFSNRHLTRRQGSSKDDQKQSAGIVFEAFLFVHWAGKSMGLTFPGTTMYGILVVSGVI